MAHMTQTTTCPEISRKTIFKSQKKWQQVYADTAFIHSVISSILHWAWGLVVRASPVLILKKLT